MIKTTNERGQEIWTDVELSSPFSADLFYEVDMSWQTFQEDTQWALHTNLGSLTVLVRRTGYGWLDTESGYRSPEGKFWLASGGMDVRESNCKTIGGAIDWVKYYANTCKGE